MALTSCPECESKVSTRAVSCPKCGIEFHVICSDCGASTSVLESACHQCNAPISHSSLSDTTSIRQSRAEVSDDASARSGRADEILDAVIGTANTEYYRKVFERFEQTGSMLSWNWPAFFATWPWLLYRKMWGYFLIYFFVLPVILSVIATLAATSQGNEETFFITYYAGYFVIGFLVIPLIANRLYYGHVTRKIDKVRTRTTDPERQLRQLYSIGGTSAAGAIAATIILGVSLVGILAAIAIPAYQDYTIRAQVSEGLNLAAGARDAVYEYLVDTDELPLNNAQAGLVTPTEIAGRYTEKVEIIDGTIEITYGGSANASIDGQILALHPTVDEEGYFYWECWSDDLPPKWVPAACR